MLRIEDKYLLTISRFDELEKRISVIMPLDEACTENGYKISSIYFDDIKDSMLNDSLDGNPYRDKYRIRIYNDSLNLIKLEVKRKYYNRSYKLSSLINVDEFNSLMLGDPIVDYNDMSDARTLFNLAIKTRGLRPKINVTYDRMAYTGESGNVRITFDRNLRASNQLELFGKDNIVFDYPRLNMDIILEVKYDEFIPNYIMQTLETRNMLQSTNSKYIICREIYEQ
jgi:hypothetical protein